MPRDSMRNRERRQLLGCGRLSVLIGFLLGMSAAYGSASLPCQPTPDCALQLARDAAFSEAATAADDASLTGSLNVLSWIFDQTPVADPASLRPSFAMLRARLERWSSPSKEMHLQGLALAMATAGLVPEARGLVTFRGDWMYQAMVDSASAGYYARRGQLKDAFELANASGDTMAREAMQGSILQSVASTGKPDLVREAARLGKLDPDQIDVLMVTAYQVAGQHDLARAQALKLVDPGVRESLVGIMALRYAQRGPESQVIPAMRLWLIQLDAVGARSLSPTALARGVALKALSERLSASGDFSGVLALVPRMEPAKRASALTSLATRLRSSTDIHNAKRESEGLLRVDRELVSDALNISRVRIGTMKAADAMKISARPRATSNFLIELARELGSAQPERAREILHAAIAPDGRIGDPDWGNVIAAQLDLGLFADATRTMDGHQRTSEERMVSQLRFSMAYAARGQEELAAQFRAQALTNFHASGILAREPGSLASRWMELEAFDDAEAELRSLIMRRVPADALRTAADELIKVRVERGETRRALEFATVWSKHQGQKSKPFTDIYCQLTGALKPQ